MNGCLLKLYTNTPIFFKIYFILFTLIFYIRQNRGSIFFSSNIFSFVFFTLRMMFSQQTKASHTIWLYFSPVSKCGQKNEACWTMPWETVRGGSRKKGRGLLPLVHFIPLDYSWMRFHASFDKLWHSIDKTCLFLLNVRT